MTRTVILTLAGPMQAWSCLPRESQIRPTQDHPTKRGVIGLVANAVGRDWNDDVSDLTGLQFAVRGDRMGILDSDYQTAGGGSGLPLLPGEVMGNPKWRKAAKTRTPTDGDFYDYLPPRDIAVAADGTLSSKPNNASLTAAQYIADAVFTVALTGLDAVVQLVADQLDSPARAVFLGRKAYLPSEPLLAGTTEHTDPAEALTEWPLHQHATGDRLPLWAEVPPMTPGAVVITDQPVNFGARKCVGRADLHTFLPGPTVTADTATTADTHDTMLNLDFFTDTP